MRSNGAAHIGNDTFLISTKDVTDRLFLFSSSFSTEEQLAALPLARKVLFHPHVALTCTSSELEHYTAAAAAAAATPSDRNRKSANDKAKSATPEPSETLTSPLFRHSLHVSPDGRQVAVISNVLRHHYIIDIAAEPAAVCAVGMPDLVRSVCWHPVRQHVLYVLFVSGDMMIYDTSRSRFGVVLPRHRRVALRPMIQRCLAEAEGMSDAAGEGPESSKAADSAAVTSKTFLNAMSADARARKSSKASKAGDYYTENKPHSPPASSSSTPLPFVSPSVYASGAAADGGSDDVVPRYEAHITSSPTTGTMLTTSRVVPTPSRAAAERGAFDEVIPIDAEPNDELSPGVAQVSSYDGADVAGGSKAPRCRTAQIDLVDLYALPPTASLPVILLVLSSSGDVYAVHLSDDDALPVLATAAAVDDGRVGSLEEERQWQQAQASSAATATAVNAEVHHLIDGALTSSSDEALAVRGCLVDADAGTHAVFFYTANGNLSGAWVSEPDLLARHRTAHARATGEANLSFTVRLDGRASAVARECLSPAVPSTTHTVTMALSNNLCLLRCGEVGEASYLLAMPCWDSQRQGWSCWQPMREAAQATAELRRALPLLSTEDAIPPPVALRLPYDTRGASVALGESELLLAPELSSPQAGVGERHRIFSIAVLSLLRAALYARCGTLQLHPAAAYVKAPVAATAATPCDTVALVRSTTTTQPNAAAASRAALLELVNLIPPLQRKWLCGAPQTEMDAATVQLTTQVERQVRDVEQRERVQSQRRERLMARVAALERRLADVNGTIDHWQQTLLDAIVHRRGGAAVRTANERLGEVHKMLNEWEQQL